MIRLVLSTVSLAIAAAMALPAQAQTAPGANTLKCVDFRRNPDGSWSPMREVTIRYPNGIVSLGPPASFPASGTYMGLPLAQMLNQKCAVHP